MSAYDNYKHLIGRPYVSGRYDCYGLARAYYKDLFGITLLNFARPEGFSDTPDLNVIDNFMHCDQWQLIGVNPRNLRIGDGLILALRNGRANHVGVYVGNGHFIHHLHGRFSAEETLTPSWQHRLLNAVRHPGVTAFIDKHRTRLNALDLLPAHVRPQTV